MVSSFLNDVRLSTVLFWNTLDKGFLKYVKNLNRESKLKGKAILVYFAGEVMSEATGDFQLLCAEGLNSVAT